jgi:hypothetical protein
MPDTEANQREYPQIRAQKPGVGFPLMRIVVIFSLAVGTVLEAAFNPYRGKETGETAMLRALLGCLELGDLLLGDRGFANYWLIVLALQSGIDVVLRQHQRRTGSYGPTSSGRLRVANYLAGKDGPSLRWIAATLAVALRKFRASARQRLVFLFSDGLSLPVR